MATTEVAYKTEVEVITEFLTTIGEELKADLEANGRNATGRTIRSIQVVDVSRAGGKLIGAANVPYTFGGRGPGRMPPLSAIVDWCNAKGIPRERAYAIAKRIRDEGTRLFRAGARDNNALTRALDPDRVQQFVGELSRYYFSTAKSDFDYILGAQ